MASKPFAWDIKHFPTVESFTAYLASLARPGWATGLTIHHTAVPTVEQWRQKGGRRAMEDLRIFYRDLVVNQDGSKGWPAGPQLFVGPDGIWQGTPVTQIGVHATVCNPTRIGIEVVGDYDLGPWQEPIKGLAYGAIAALCRWLKVPSSRINGHRDCASSKTCPGRYIQIPTIRSVIDKMLAAPQLPPDSGIDPRLAAVWLGAHGAGHDDKESGLWIPGPGYGVSPAIVAPDGNGILQRCERMYIGIDRAGRARFPLLSELLAWGIL
jgi:hypothetical protein